MTGSASRSALEPVKSGHGSTVEAGGFVGALVAVRDVEGWLTEAQAQVLYDGAAALEPGAAIVEIGSYRGRSAIVLARAAPADVTVVAIDSHGGDNRGPRQVEGRLDEGQADHDAFLENIRRTGVESRIRHVRARSQDALALVPGSVGLLYVDGAHQYRAARDDIRRWGARVRPGGTMLVHDGFSSVGVTLALLRALATDEEWQYLGRTGSLVAYRRDRASRAANLRGHAAELPWFARNVAIKLGLVTRQRWACRALGHDGQQWPY
jgi:predicted O-methyltransferase YrrM